MEKLRRATAPVLLVTGLIVSGTNSFLTQPSSRSSSTIISKATRPSSFLTSFRSGIHRHQLPIVLMSSATSLSSATSSTKIPESWAEIKKRVGSTPVGQALDQENLLRLEGKGSAHVHNKLRKFDSPEEELPGIILYRDHAGWCPYCQKLMLLVEEKRVPVELSLVPMRSYGDKPAEFMRKVPGGLLPAMEVNGKVITESQVIMELLDQWHPEEDGYRPMLPSDQAGYSRYQVLAKLERDLFSWWCTLVFRPDGPSFGLGGGNPLSNLLGGGQKSTALSGAMQGFLDCLRKVDKELLATKGPWFFDEHDYPTMIDFVYVSHVERMLASCVYWKGLNLRDTDKWNLVGLNAWLEAFEKREAYLAFKSDYFTHVMDIPPQYGPGIDGGFEDDRIQFSGNIHGAGRAWHLPLPHDDELQPLYRGPPLPVCVLKSMDLEADADGSYEGADPKTMEHACRVMAAWKLAGNGEKVAKFAARGGPKGSKNPRKSFGGPLADPYANSDVDVQPYVDKALRVVCCALAAVDEDPIAWEAQLRSVVASAPGQASGVASSLAYLRDRVGVPRDLPLASARYLRAYLNWGIDTLSSTKTD